MSVVLDSYTGREVSGKSRREEAVERTMEKIAEKKRIEEAKMALKGKKGRKKK